MELSTNHDIDIALFHTIMLYHIANDQDRVCEQLTNLCESHCYIHKREKNGEVIGKIKCQTCHSVSANCQKYFKK